MRTRRVTDLGARPSPAARDERPPVGRPKKSMVPWAQPAFVVRALPDWDATESAASLWLVRRGRLAPRRVRVEAHFAYDQLPGVEPIVAVHNDETPGALEFELPTSRGPRGRAMVAAVMFDPTTLAAPRFVVRWQVVKTGVMETVLRLSPATRAA
jgi:hypothetical protein